MTTQRTCGLGRRRAARLARASGGARRPSTRPAAVDGWWMRPSPSTSRSWWQPDRRPG